MWLAAEKRRTFTACRNGSRCFCLCNHIQDNIDWIKGNYFLLIKKNKLVFVLYGCIICDTIHRKMNLKISFMLKRQDQNISFIPILVWIYWHRKLWLYLYDDNCLSDHSSSTACNRILSNYLRSVEFCNLYQVKVRKPCTSIQCQ